MFEWAGVGFSRGETFRVAAALQNIAAKEQTTTMRLWGKIIGKSIDYYIAEGEVSEAHVPEDPSTEEGPSGANQKTYWAMKDDGEYTWVKLPAVSQAQILSARKLRRFVSDDLEAKVAGNPPFPGVEKNFLRAQIARISSSTVICPTGFYSATEDGDVQVEEESSSKSADDLKDPSNWVHLSKEINAGYGRCTAMPSRENADGEDAPYEDQTMVEPLRSLSEDAADSWKSYTVPSTSNASPNVGQVAVIKSLVWPGAASVGLGKKFLNIYVGHGVKYSATPYQPTLPQPLQTGFGLAVPEPVEGEEVLGLTFTPLEEQPDVIDDPTPLEEEEDDDE